MTQNEMPTVWATRRGITAPTIGLALSGGATRGVAHLGVLKALHENGIEPNAIAGTSIGALVGALYAFDVPVDDILGKALTLTWGKVSSFAFSRSGLLSNKQIGQIVHGFIGNARIEEASIPLAVVTTDIRTGEQIVLTEGDVARAVMASTCIPGIFMPVKIDERVLVDGFLTENVPLSPLKRMQLDILIGVNLSATRSYRDPDGIIDIMMNAFEIAVDANTTSRVKDADILICPELSPAMLTDPSLAEQYFKIGYDAAIDRMAAIRAVINDKQAPRGQGVFQKLLNLFN